MKLIILNFILLFPYFLCAQIDTEPINNTLAGADELTIGVENKAAINPANDSDYFKFTISQPGVIIITVTNVPGNIDMDYEFFDEQGLSVYSTGFSNGNGFVIDGLACEPGTYAFRLGDDEGNPAQYCVRVDFDTSDIYECNNTYQTATPIPLATNIYASIYDEHDSDYYSFEITQPGVIIITVTNVPGNIDMDYEFFDEQGLSVYSTGFSNGNGFVIDGLACEPGTYTFRLGDDEGNPAQYCVRVDFDTSDIYECNNTYQTATPIPLATNIYASIYDEHDSDYYSFEITQAGVIIITVTNVPDNIDMDYEFFDEQGLSVYSTGFSNGNGFVIDGLACEPGTYTFRLGDDEGNPAQYCVRVDFDTSDIYECNNTYQTATPIPLATNIYASIYDEHDSDYYSFEITQAGVIIITVTNVPDNIDMDYEFFDEQGLSVYSTGFSNGEGFVIDGLVCEPGTYTFRLGDDEGNSAQYCVRVDFDTSDIYECNQDFTSAAAIDCNVPIFASINPANDNDCYEITLTEADLLTINVTNVPANLNLSVGLYDSSPSTNLLASQNGNTGETINFTSPETLQIGTYYVCITDNKANENQYQLTVTCPSLVNNENLIANKMINVYPNPTNNELRVKGISNRSAFKVINHCGKVVLNGNLNHQTINLSSLDAGFYFISFFENGYKRTFKIIKQ